VLTGGTDTVTFAGESDAMFINLRPAARAAAWPLIRSRIRW
jgi:hypothetical protein